MALKFKKNPPPQAETKVETKNKGVVLSEKNDTEKVDVPETVASPAPSAEPYCEVGFDASYTMNLGDYNSTRVSVSLKIPCRHSEIDDVFTYANEWVNGKMEALIDDAKPGNE